MYEIVKAAYDIGFDGPIRPDHGRMIWGEEGRPGYGLYDRALVLTISVAYGMLLTARAGSYKKEEFTMLHLNRQSLKENRAEWEKAGITLYSYDDEAVQAATQQAPQWVHFGGGNIFRAFIAALQQHLLNKGLAKTGIITAETYDEEVIEKVYRPFDNLSLAVTMYADGRFEKEVIGSVMESVVCRPDFKADWQRLKDIFTNPSLQVASFTITEKGYKLKDYASNFFPAVAEDMKKGPEQATSSMGCIAALAYARYQAGAYPFAFLSLDNCSHNGDKIKEAILTFADEWAANGVATKDSSIMSMTRRRLPSLGA